MKLIGTCEQCGTEFTQRMSTQRFCSDECREKAARARARARNHDQKNAQNRAWRVANPELAKARDHAQRERRKARDSVAPETDTRRNSRLKRKYGITLVEKIEMARRQQGRCAICRQEPTETFGLIIDHCHQTGRVRSLLCHRCNTAIGLMAEDPDRLLSAADYLREHNQAA